MTPEEQERDRVATLRKARKSHLCQQCHGLILAGSNYYALTIGGGGLGSLKFPDRVHECCLNGFLAARGKRKEAIHGNPG